MTVIVLITLSSLAYCRVDGLLALLLREDLSELLILYFKLGLAELTDLFTFKLGERFLENLTDATERSAFSATEFMNCSCEFSAFREVYFSAGELRENSPCLVDALSGVYFFSEFGPCMVSDIIGLYLPVGD
jgi:hypothetical protein